MKSHTLQNLIQKIFSDEKTKRQFISDPDSVISQFSLSEREKKTVLDVHAKLGVVSSDSPQLEAAIEPLVRWF